MDDCLQVAHHRAFDDPRRGAQRDIEILGRVPFEVSDKQLHRRYVYSSRGEIRFGIHRDNHNSSRRMLEHSFSDAFG